MLQISHGKFHEDKGAAWDLQTVTVAMCGTPHAMMKNDDKQRIAACVKMGSKYDLRVGDRVYEMEGKESDLDRFPPLEPLFSCSFLCRIRQLILPGGRLKGENLCKIAREL